MQGTMVSTSSCVARGAVGRPRGGKRATRFLSADAAAAIVRDGDTVAVSGCLFNLVPEALCAALERRFLASGSPRGLTAYHLNIYGFGAGTGIDHFAHAGLTRRMIGSSYPAHPWAAASPTTRMILQGALEAIALPAGVIAENFRAMGAGRPGFATRTGLGTFIDPRLGAGRLNDAPPDGAWRPATVIDCDGTEQLYFRSEPINVSFIQGSVADADGGSVKSRHLGQICAGANVYAINAH